jgi:hypothetical protein
MHFWVRGTRLYGQFGLRVIFQPEPRENAGVGPLRPAIPRAVYRSPAMSFCLCATLSHPLCISKPVQVIRTFSTPLLWTARSHTSNADHHASCKLFADAEHEERTGTHRGAKLEQPNWTGDESMEDAVLRMLVDKYKPLRTGTIRTAEEKMHRAPPRILVCNSQK